MKSASDILANHPQAIEYCKRFGGENWMELYNDAWLAIREKEIRGTSGDIRNPIEYFKWVALSKSKYRKTRLKKQVDIVLSDDLVNRFDYTTEDTKDKIEQIEETINKYLDKEPENMIDKFYQDFCRAILGFKTIREAQEEMGICRTTFWLLLNQLQDDLKNET